MNYIQKYLARGEVALGIIFLIDFVFFSFASEYFFTLRNIMNVSGQLSIINPNVAHTMVFTKDTTFLNLVRGRISLAAA